MVRLLLNSIVCFAALGGFWAFAPFADAEEPKECKTTSRAVSEIPQEPARAFTYSRWIATSNPKSVLACLALVPAPDRETSEDELKKIQGDWAVVKISWAGTISKIEKSVEIERDNFRLRDGTGTAWFQIKRINSGQIDLLKRSEGRGSGDLLHGIYSLEGDKLTICFPFCSPKDEPEKRPQKFETSPESPCVVYFLKRKTNSKKKDDK